MLNKISQRCGNELELLSGLVKNFKSVGFCLEKDFFFFGFVFCKCVQNYNSLHFNQKLATTGVKHRKLKIVVKICKELLFLIAVMESLGEALKM